MKEKYNDLEIEFINVELDILTMASCPNDASCPAQVGCPNDICPVD